MRRTVVLGVLVLVACNGDEGTLPADSDGANDACGEALPVIESLTIANAGMTDPTTDDSCGAEFVPLVRITAHATDEDGDLHYWTMNTWWDTELDDTVDTTGSSIEVSSTQGLDCRTFEADLTMILCLSGDPPYSTPVEWAAVVSDDQNHASNVAITTFTTPASDGTP
jgi:hypothetical protein